MVFISKGSFAPLYFTFIILSIASTLLNAWIPITERSWIFLSFGCIGTLLVQKHYFRSSQSIWLILYSVFVLGNFLIEDYYFSNFPRVLSELAAMLFTSSITFYVIKNSDIKTMKAISLSMIIIIVTAAIGSFMAESFFPGAIRYAQGLNKLGESDSLTVQMYRMGMANYFLPHALPALIPSFVVGIRNNSFSMKKKLFILVILISLFVIVLLSGAATPLLTSFILLGISLLTKEGSIKQNKTLIFTLLLIFIIFKMFSGIIADLLYSFADILGEEGATATINIRINELGDFLLHGNEGRSLGARLDLYEQTQNEFFANPLFGTNNPVGGHSTIMDRLATLGIIGTIPWLFFITSSAIFALKWLGSRLSMYYIVGFSGALLMLFTKNMGNTEMWLCLLTFLPITLKLWGVNSNCVNEN